MLDTGLAVIISVGISDGDDVGVELSTIGALVGNRDTTGIGARESAVGNADDGVSVVGATDKGV